MLSKKYMKPKVLNALSINQKRDFNDKIGTELVHVIARWAGYVS